MDPLTGFVVDYAAERLIDWAFAYFFSV